MEHLQKIDILESERSCTISIEEYCKRLITLHESGDIGFWFIKAGTDEIVFSEIARKIYELDSGITITIPKLLTIIPSTDVPIVESIISDLKTDKTDHFNMTHGFITKSGKLKYVQSWGVKQSRSNHPEGVYGAIRDITIEKENAEKEEIYSRYLDMATELGKNALWRYAIDEPYSRVTEWYRALGYSLERKKLEALKEWERLLHPKDKERAIDLFNRFLAGEILEYEDVYRLRNAKGEYVYIKTYGKAIEFTEKGKPSVVIGTLSDITDIVQMQERLKNTEMKQMFLMENVADFVIQVDTYGKILFETKRFRKTASSLKEDSTLLFDYIHKDDRDILLTKLTEINQNSQVVTSTCRLGDSNRYIWFNLHVKGIFDETGVLDTFIVIGNDITEKVDSQRVIRESEMNLRMLVENVKDLIIKLDGQNKISYVADNASLILGIPVEFMKGITLAKIFYDIKRDRVKETIVKIRENLGADITFKARVNTSNGVRWYEWSGRGLDARGDIVCIGRDVTAVIKQQNKNEELVRKIDTTLDVAGIATWDWDLINDHITFSPMLFKMLGRPEEPMENHGFDMINQWINPEDLKCIVEDLTPEEKAKRQLLESKFRIMKANGEYVWFQSRGYVTEWDDEGRSKRALGVYINITKEQQLQDELKYMAYHDELTGLYNRKRIIELMETALAEGKLHKAAAITLDIDNFKATNDIFGHAVGDMLLISMAQTLKARVGDMGQCARLAGDEFFIFIPEFKDKQDVIDLTSKLINFFGNAMTLPNDHDIDISMSAGVVFYPDDTTDIDMLINYSDIAMLQAKEIGKNRFVLYNGEVTKQYYQSHQLLYDIRSAIKNKEFLMYYHPVVDLENNEVVQLEALIRWQHPTYGMLMPSGFIHVAETSGEITNIFKAVYKKTLLQLKKWQRKKPNLSLSINLSARQLTEVDFCDYLISVAEEVGIKPERLIFEITETTLLHVVETVRTNIKAIRSHGFMLALDDFGMEYSSLAMLEKVGFDMIKIDRFFVINFEDSFVSKEVIKMISSIIKGLDKQSIVEGVETEQQLETMQSLGFQWIQGFYFSKPLPEKEVDRFVREFKKRQKKKGLKVI